MSAFVYNISHTTICFVPEGLTPNEREFLPPSLVRSAEVGGMAPVVLTTTALEPPDHAGVTIHARQCCSTEGGDDRRHVVDMGNMTSSMALLPVRSNRVRLLYGSLIEKKWLVSQKASAYYKLK